MMKKKFEKIDEPAIVYQKYFIGSSKAEYGKQGIYFWLVLKMSYVYL